MDGLGAVVTLEPSGRVGGGFAVAGGDAGLVAVWFEQAAQMPSNLAPGREALYGWEEPKVQALLSLCRVSQFPLVYGKRASFNQGSA